MAYLDKSGDWGRRMAPTLEELESLARISFSKLPEKLRLLCQNIIIHIADFPDDNLLDEMGLDSPFDLLCLFQGTGSSSYFSLKTVENSTENRINLFRRPILDYWAENEETLDEIIAHLLLNELGRPFGFSEEDMEKAINAT